MKIEILGSGCPKCKQLVANIEKALEELGKQAEVLKVNNLNEIMSYGVMITPALVVNGVVRVAGKVPSIDYTKEILPKG